MQRGNISALLLNLLTVLLLLGTAASAGAFALIFVNPAILPPPFHPAPLPPTASIPTATSTSFFPTLPPEWTATPTSAPPTASATRTASPTSTTGPSPTITHTPGPTFTGTPGPTLTPTASPERSATPTVTVSPTGLTPTPSRTLSAFAFTLQGSTPVYSTNTKNAAGCNWLGIAGQAFDLEGHPVTGLVVHLEGGGLDIDALTGSATAYGPGGYEHFLDAAPKDTTNVFRVQLLNTSGAPLSDVIVVDTFNDCAKNLILVNFVQNH